MNNSILFFGNGNAAVLADGKQQAELQKPWAALYAEFLMSQGHDPEKFELHFPNGGKARFFRISPEEGGGWNWDFEVAK